MTFPTLSKYINEDGEINVINPATQKSLGYIKSYSVDEVKTCIEKADAAQKDWAAHPAKERSEILLRWFNLIMENQEELAKILTAECGKPLKESSGEIAYGASFVQWFAEEAKRSYGETVPHFRDGSRVMTIKQPIGNCAAITPWNFPNAMITRKAGPALAAGCSMIVKPATATPLSALALETLAQRAGVPADLFRILPSNDSKSMGELYCTHPKIRKISFTGSTAIGKMLMKQSADTVKKVSMELGGNAPFIVFDDANLDAAVEGAMAAKYRNAGQTCVCANRFLVQEGVHDEFVKRLTKATAALKVGDGSDDGVEIGPLIDGSAVDQVERFVASAVSDNGKIETGGKRSDKGPLFYEPTVISNLPSTADIFSEEIFGPVSPIVKFSDEAEAIRIANDTPYGLAAYFYARDIGRIYRVMEALEYGMVGVNEGLISTEVAPFGGIKESGVGREGSLHGIDEYMELKYCLIGGLAQ